MGYNKRYYINYIEKVKDFKKQIKDIKKIPSECLNCEIHFSKLQKKCKILNIPYCSLSKKKSKYKLFSFNEINKLII